MVATRDAEAEKVAKAAAIREEQFVDRVAFLAHNARGKDSFFCIFYVILLHALFDFSVLMVLHCASIAEAAGVPAHVDPLGEKCHSIRL